MSNTLSGYIKSENGGDRIELVDAQARSKMHDHSNKEVIDTITSNDILKWNNGSEIIKILSEEDIDNMSNDGYLNCDSFVGFESGFYYFSKTIYIMSQDGTFEFNPPSIFSVFMSDECNGKPKLYITNIDSSYMYFTLYADRGDNNELEYINEVYYESILAPDVNPTDGQILASNNGEIEWVDSNTVVTDERINSLIDAKINALDGSEVGF